MRIKNNMPLKEALDTYLQEYGLNSFDAGQINVEIKTYAFTGDFVDIFNYVEKVVRDYGELRGGEKVGESTDVKSKIWLEEIDFADFSYNFLLMDTVIGPCITEDDFRKVCKQMSGAKRLAYAFHDINVDVFDTHIPFGYCDGGVYVLYKGKTREIVVVTVYCVD